MQMRASFYKSYALRLASWGFAVLQYDIPLLTTLPDTPEVYQLYDHKIHLVMFHQIILLLPRHLTELGTAHIK